MTFYKSDETYLFQRALEIIKPVLPSLMETSLPHVRPDRTVLIIELTSILVSLVQFCSEAEKEVLLETLLDRFPEISLGAAKISYASSCVEILLRDAEKLCPNLSPTYMDHIFRVGYQTQSNFLADVIEMWMKKNTTNRITCFANLILSYESLWKSTSFSLFEARIFGPLSLTVDGALSNMEKKLEMCDINLDSIENVLSLRTIVFKVPQKNERQLLSANRARMENILNSYVGRCVSTVERMIDDEEIADSVWNVLPDFIKAAVSSAKIDLEKWLGKICKHDLHGLIPKAPRSIQAILEIDMDVYHRRLPGWIARVFSRMTRRFAEDRVLSPSALESVKQLGMDCGCEPDVQIL